jgi:peptide/nickel transport system permease protein
VVRFLGWRLLAAVPTLLLLSLAAFSLLYLVPGDPARVIAGETTDPAQVEAIRTQLGLNDPYLTRFGDWLGGLFRGDLGTSLYSSASVGQTLADRLPVTLSLALLAVVITVVVAVPLGVLAGLRPGTWMDRITSLSASFGVSVPNFWIGLMLVLLFAITLGWLPAVGFQPLENGVGEWARHLILPAFTLALPAIAEVSRQLRASVVDAAHSDYVRTARAKGLPEVRVVGKHLLKNALVPAVTVLGLQLAYMLGGTVVVEQVFGLPGIGSYAIQAVDQRDFPVIQAVVLLAGIMVILVNILVDLSYGYLNPRVRR